MRLHLRKGLPYVAVTLAFRNAQLVLDNVLLDTGSAGSVFSADRVAQIGLDYAPTDMLHRIHGVGGAEFVFAKRVDRLTVDELQVEDFEIEVGALDYGFEINGILGMNFLTTVGAIIDLNQLEIRLPTA